MTQIWHKSWQYPLRQVAFYLTLTHNITLNITSNTTSNTTSNITSNITQECPSDSDLR